MRATICVLVPTYGRPDDLERCLRALERQSRRPDDVLVVSRPDDDLTSQRLAALAVDLPLRRAQVTEPGVVAALNKGLSGIETDIVAILDDDTAPHSHWLERIERHFADDRRVGGVGGRDHLYRYGELLDERKARVGAIQWFGRTVGNHHAGFGEPRDVEVLKGANMSFRREAVAGLAFDPRLRGRGAQVCNDMAFSLAVHRRGWRVIYDPSVSVDHFWGVRHDSDQRHRIFDAESYRNAVHNQTLVLLEYLPPWRRAVFLIWAVLIGQSDGPGLVQWVRFALAGDPAATRKLRASLKGRASGWRAWLAGAVRRGRTA